MYDQEDNNVISMYANGLATYFKGLCAKGLGANSLVVLSILLFTIALVVRLLAASQTGLVYDEPTYVKAGLEYVRTVMNLHFSQSTYTFNMEHPPVGKYVYGIVQYFFNGNAYNYGSFVLSRLASAVLGSLVCVMTLIIGRRFFSPRIGVLAGAVLAFTPMFIAHTTVACLDSPLVFFITLMMLAFMVAVEKSSLKWYFASAACFSLALSTKYNVLLMLPVMAIFLLYMRRDRLHSPDALKRGAFHLVLWVGIVVVIFVALWPYLWHDPLGSLRASLEHWTYIPQNSFLGVYQGTPIYDYYPVYFLVTTPIVMLGLLALGFVGVLKNQSLYKYALLLWFLVPFAYDLSTMVQDSMRYLLMIYPALALLCALGAERLAEFVSGYLSSRHKLASFANVYTMIGAITIIWLLLVCLSVQPLYLDYYNELSGGYQKVVENKLFIYEYWGEALRPNVDYLEGHATNASIGLMDYHVWNTPEFFWYANPLKNNKYVLLNKSTSYNQAWLNNNTHYNYLIISQGVQAKGLNPLKSHYTLVYTEMLGDQPIYNVYKNTGTNKTK